MKSAHFYGNIAKSFQPWEGNVDYPLSLAMVRQEGRLAGHTHRPCDAGLLQKASGQQRKEHHRQSSEKAFEQDLGGHKNRGSLYDRGDIIIKGTIRNNHNKAHKTVVGPVPQNTVGGPNNRDHIFIANGQVYYSL